MMSKVIVLCAVALSFKIVASIPYSVDFQRYPGFQSRPTLQPSFQPSPARQYQYANQNYNAGAYRNPMVQNQEQQLPQMSRENYFLRNPQHYLPKDPPLQPEILNRQYINQQNPQYRYPANQVQEILPLQLRPNNIESSVQYRPQIVTTDPFIPAIPAVPTRISYPSDNEVPRRIDDGSFQKQDLRLEEITIPVIRPPPPPPFESEPQVDNLDRFRARAINPVETIQPKKPERPSLETYLSHPKIKEVLATTKHQKRYLVIHPDGTVEHVDKLDYITEKHPNFMLVKAGEIIPNQNNNKIVIQPPLPLLPVPELEKVQKNIEAATPAKPVIPAPIQKPIGETEVLKPNPAVSVQTEKGKPSIVKVEAAVKESTTLSPSVQIGDIAITTTEATITTMTPAVPLEINIAKLLPPLENNVNAKPKQESSKVVIVTQKLPTENNTTTIAPSVEATTVAPSSLTTTEALKATPSSQNTTNIPAIKHIDPIKESPQPTIEPKVVASTSPAEGTPKLPKASANATIVSSQNSTDIPTINQTDPSKKSLQPSQPQAIVPKVVASPLPIKGVLKLPEVPTAISTNTTTVSPQNTTAASIINSTATSKNSSETSQPISIVPKVVASPLPIDEALKVPAVPAVVSTNTTTVSSQNATDIPLINQSDPSKKNPQPSQPKPTEPAIITPIPIIETSKPEIKVPISIPEKPSSPATLNTVATTEPNTIESTSVTSIESKSPKNDTEPVTSPSSDVPINMDANIFEEASEYVLPQDIEVPNFGDLDISKIPQKPSLLFRTTDPNIWEKLADKDQNLGVIYFFQIHNQPKIERDVRTTIHQNGTVVEEVIETSWAFEGDEPTVTKTSKIIQPKERTSTK